MQPAPLAVETRDRASASASLHRLHEGAGADFTSSTSASSPAASFFDRIDAVMRSIDSTVAGHIADRVKPAVGGRDVGRSRRDDGAASPRRICAQDRLRCQRPVRKPGIASSLSSVPPGVPEPAARDHRDIGAAGRQRGASRSEVQSPIPPVECLSTTGPGRSQSSTCPLSRMARVRATRPSSPTGPFSRTAMAKAPAWASVTSPEARPCANQSPTPPARAGRRRAASR